MPDELLDVINDRDQVIAQEMRSVVHHKGLQHRGIHLFLFTPENKLLVQTRSRNQKAYPSALDCSVSEHVKAGETYLQAARRGLLEELGLQRVRLSPLIKFSMQYGPNDLEICTLYQGKVNPAAVHFDPVELAGIAYYKLEELEALIVDSSLPFSSWFIQLIYWYQGRPGELKPLRLYQPRQVRSSHR